MFADDGLAGLLAAAKIPLNHNLNDAALKKRGKPKLGRKGTDFSSPPAESLTVRGAQAEYWSSFTQFGRPMSNALIAHDVALPLPSGVRRPLCGQGTTCRNGIELAPLEKLAILCENLPADVFDCNPEIGVTIPEFLITTPDMMSVMFPDPVLRDKYVSFGGLDQTLIKLRDELIDNPRELTTLAEYCLALRAKGDTWTAIDCFQWTLELVNTEQFDKDSGRWAQPSAEGYFSRPDTVEIDLRINYGETLLLAGLVEQAIAAFESAPTPRVPKGEAKAPFNLGFLAAGRARDLSATHTYESALKYAELVRASGRPGWQVYHSPEWYRWGPFYGACQWVLGLIIICLCCMRVCGFRLWVQCPSLSCVGVAVCCEFGGAVYVLHARVPQPNLDNAVSLAAAAAARNGNDDCDAAPVAPVFLAHEKRENIRGKGAAWRDVEMKIELPSHQLVGHLELMVPLSCCCCNQGGRRRSWCSKAVCFSVAYTFGDLDIQLLKVSAAATTRNRNRDRDSESDTPVSGARRRAGVEIDTDESQQEAPSMSAIRIDFVSHTIFGTMTRTHTLHMNEAPGFSLDSILPLYISFCLRVRARVCLSL